MQSQHYNQQNKFNIRISDTNNNKLRTNNKQIKQAINESTNWHLLKTYSYYRQNLLILSAKLFKNENYDL